MTNKYDQMIPEAARLSIDKNEELNTIYQNPEFLPEDEVIVEKGDDIVIYSGDEALNYAREPDFDDNLAEFFNEEKLSDLAGELVAKYEEDRTAREPRDAQYNEAMRRAGVDERASPSGADFEGSSEVVHPMLSKASVDFAARSIRELCPPSGLVKSEIIGEATSKKVDESQRKVGFMNNLFIRVMPYRNVLQQTLSQLPLAGSQFIKFWFDPYLKRPNCEFLPLDHVYIPFSCNDFYTAERVTVRTDLSPVEYWRRVKNGVYYDPTYEDQDEERSPEEAYMPSVMDATSNKIEFSSKTDITNDKIEGKEEGGADDSYTILEIYTYLNLKEDHLTNGEYAPYIVTIRADDETLLGLYRNWDIKDEKKHKLDYIVKFGFIPWRGALDLGLGQLIGSLSAAGTGAFRALLDSAHTNNLPTALGLKGMKMAGQSPSIGVGQITFLEGPNGLEDDIKKCFMPLPFNPPSPVLFELLRFVTEQAETVVKMPDGVVNGMGDRTPANTTLAMIEQGSTTQSAIHANLHFSQMKCFEIVSRLLCNHFDPDGFPSYLVEDYKMNAELFSSTRDIVPVSDPNIFTEVQRYAQMEAVMNLAQSAPPGTFDMNQIYKRMLQLIKIPQPDMLLTLPGEVCKSNAVAENAAVMMGKGVQVYPDQNHLDHLYVHLAFLKDPVYGQNPAFNTNNVAMIGHIKEHLMYFYAQVYQQAVKNESQVESFNIMGEDAGAFDAQLKDLTPDVLQEIQDTLAPFIPEATPIIQSLMQMQQQQQQQNMSPEQVKVQIEQAKLQQIQSSGQAEQQKMQINQQESQAKIQLEQAKMQNQQQSDQMHLQLEQMKAQSEVKISELQLATEKEESEASIYIEQLRVENDRKQALETMRLELFKHQSDMQLEALKHGQNLGLDAAKHSATLRNDKDKHLKTLENLPKKTEQ